MSQQTVTRTTESNHPLINEYARDRIEYRVMQLARAFRLSETDQDDLRQDMAMELLKAGDRFDPAIAGRKTFITRVLNTFYQRYLRRHRQRSNHRVFRPVGFRFEGFWLENLRDSGTSEQELIELQLDIETIMQRLSPRLQTICQSLMHESPAETARQMKLSKPTISRAMARIRESFTEAGYEKIF